MRKILYLLSTLLIGSGITVSAAPGDTTWVQANQVNLNYFNNFDTAVTFPNGNITYRKILMYFTLGQYNCSASEQYCHQWDYTVQNYVMTPGGDTVEISRFITPFATSGWSRFGSSWQQPYIFDVTDFYPLLKNNATIRIHYSGYSGGFTANVKFAFIEGTPDRNVVGISKIYDGSPQYGNPANPINTHFDTLNLTAPTGAVSAAVRTLITGHGSDGNQCCEFDSHNFDINLNGSSIAHTQIWRADCGTNELYPQGGTWTFNRSNWCPGAVVYPYVNTLPGISSGSQYNLNFTFENYTNTAGNTDWGVYTTTAAIIYYGAINKTLDASLDAIVSPTNDPNYYRENPSGSIPVVIVHNSGSTPITSLDFAYGVQDSTVHNYNWNGTIAPLTDTTISLPAIQEFANMSFAQLSGEYGFHVAITGVNGQVDEDSTNNSLSSRFMVAPLLPSDLALSLKTGNLTQNNSGGFGIGNPQQTWTITDMNDSVIAARINTAANTQYNDTVALPAAGLYKLKIVSGNRMGLHWWPWDGNNNVIPGAFKLTNLQSQPITMRNYAYTGTPHDDFGSEYVFYFSADHPGSWVTDINHVILDNPVKIYPNPARDFINIDFAQSLSSDNTYRLINVLGQTVLEKASRAQNLQLNTKNLAAGVYTLLIESQNQVIKTQKIVLTK